MPLALSPHNVPIFRFEINLRRQRSTHLLTRRQHGTVGLTVPRSGYVQAILVAIGHVLHSLSAIMHTPTSLRAISSAPLLATLAYLALLGARLSGPAHTTNDSSGTASVTRSHTKTVHVSCRLDGSMLPASLETDCRPRPPSGRNYPAARYLPRSVSITAASVPPRPSKTQQDTRSSEAVVMTLSHIHHSYIVAANPGSRVPRAKHWSPEGFVDSRPGSRLDPPMLPRRMMYFE